MTVTVDDSIPWSAEEEGLMKEHLHGVVLYPTSSEGMTVRWEDSEIIAEGGYVEGTGLADYAARYSDEDGWQDITDQYSVPADTAYIFEKAVDTEDGTRYVRVFVYAEDEFTDFATEGSLIIESYDPYVYAWPADVFAALTESFISDEEVPSVKADHYYSAPLSYTVVAYYESNEADGGYGVILEEAGWQVEEADGYYHSLSPDGMYSLDFSYSDGALTLTIGYAWDAEWPATLIAKHFEHYAPQGAEAFDVPVFEGASSYVFVDYEYNDGNQDVTTLHGTVKALDSNADLHSAYLEKLATGGWTRIEETDSYMKDAGDGKVYLIEVRYVADADKSSNIDGGTTEIAIYYVKRDDPTKGWQAQAVQKVLDSMFFTDTLPAYEGEIISFEVKEEFGSQRIYIYVPDEDFDTAKDNYVQTLFDAGYTQTGESTWLIRYISPNNQIKLTVSTSSYPVDSLYITIEQVAKDWDAEIIEKGLQTIGSSVNAIPEFITESELECTYIAQGDTFTITVSSSNFTSAECTAYLEALKSANGWTVDNENSTATKVVLTASDGTTLTATRKYGDSGNLIITITHPAE